MSRTISFEAANSDDVSDIRRLLAASGLPVDDLESYLPDFIVAKIEAQTIACVGLECGENIGLLRSLAVSDRFRGQGIAQQLCRQLEHLALAKGILELYLLTTTAPDFFKKIGYVKTSRDDASAWIKSNKQLTTLCPSTAVLMRKIL